MPSHKEPKSPFPYLLYIAWPIQAYIIVFFEYSRIVFLRARSSRFGWRSFHFPRVRTNNLEQTSTRSAKHRRKGKGKRGFV